MPLARKSKIARRKSAAVCIVRAGSVQVPIYQNDTRNKKTGTLYTAFLAYYYDETGARRALKCARLEDLKQKVADKARLIAKGEVSSINLTATQAAAWQEVEKISATMGKTALSIVEEYKGDFLLLRPGLTARECINYYNKHNHGVVSTKTLQEIYEELIATKTADKVSDEHLRDLKKRLPKFISFFDCGIDQITGEGIESWLRSLKVQKKALGGGYITTDQAISSRTRKNIRNAIQNFFNFAKKRNYVSKDFDVMDAVSVPKTRIEKIEIFTPEEISKLLNAANDIQRPFIAIFAFSGVRHYEIKRLTWENIRWDSRYIAVNAESAKVGERRLVPISDNLLAWLLKYRNRTGPICLRKNFDSQISRLSKKAGVKWKRNAPRHSYVSYRVSETQNVPQVALESGNSVKKIFSNYRELVTPKEAARWFAIRPGKTKKQTVISVTKLLQKQKAA